MTCSVADAGLCINAGAGPRVSHWPLGYPPAGGRTRWAARTPPRCGPAWRPYLQPASPKFASLDVHVPPPQAEFLRACDSTATFAAASIPQRPGLRMVALQQVLELRHTLLPRSCLGSSASGISLPSCMPSRRTSQRKAVNSRITPPRYAASSRRWKTWPSCAEDAGVECQLLLLLSFRNDQRQQGDERSDAAPTAGAAAAAPVS